MSDLITEIDILDEAKDNFLTYAEEVLCDRAIPAAEDGLLSAQRKILWTMEEYLKMNSKSKTKKCNAIVGSTLSTSYYHGDASCYGVLCKMSQEYLMRYPLIKGQGSLGTQENNQFKASARYTEAKPSVFTDLMMNDFGKNVVPLKETYNGEFFEPVFLPSLFPNALCNGRQTIGISMAHNSLPNNLTEVCNALIALLEKGDLTIDEVLTYIPGPDFPLGGTVINKNDIRTAFATGKSNVSLKVRGDYTIDGQKLIFTSIPYRTYRNKIKEQIEKNVDVLSEFIDDFDDESSVGENKLIFTIKRGVNPEAVANKLFALTDLQVSLSYNMNYIVDGTPKLCSIVDLLKSYVKHQSEVLIDAAKFDREKAEKRKHIIEGLLVAIEDIDRAIAIIRDSNNRQEAEERLVSYFKITEEQAKAILDMKLAKLTRLDKDDLLNELKSKIALIEDCLKIENDIEYRNFKLIEKIAEMRDKYGDARRTRLSQMDILTEKKTNDIIPEDCVVVLSKAGSIKRIPAANFKIQKRNGKGIKTIDDTVLTTVPATTTDLLLVFTDAGKMYKLLIDKIPAGGISTKGINIVSLLPNIGNEKIMAATALTSNCSCRYIVFVTKQGFVKKSLLEEYRSSRANSTGISALTLRQGDSLVSISFINDEELLLATKKGMSLRFVSAEVRSQGRTASGMIGIKLFPQDEVVASAVLKNADEKILIVGTDGFAKRVALKEFSCQKRGGKGLKINAGSQEIKTMLAVADSDNLFVLGAPNSICIETVDIPSLSRTSRGSAIIKDSEIISITTF